MKIRPDLAQFLIYGPVPGTPFYERIIKENLLQDRYTTDKDLFYRRADGFHTMIKHPTLSAEEIEAIQQWCFEQDFERLGPSIYRIMDTLLLGYRKLKDSPNPLLRAKADCYARQLRYAYPIFLAGRLFGPNAGIRRWIGDLERRIQAELGRPSFAQQCKSVLALAAAGWTGLTLKLDLFQHPKLTRTTYRLPSERWGAFEAWEGLHRKFASPDFSIQVELQHAKQQVWMRLEGVLTRKDAEGLGRQISESLAQSKNQLVLDFNKLRWEKKNDLKPLLEKLANYRSRIRVVVPRLSAAHPELIVVAAMFEAYHR
jgi:hypothetical protein